MKIFISYARQDAHALEDLQLQLAAIERIREIDVWSDQRIAVGTNWREEIEIALARADMVIFLVSPHFVASPFCGEELRRAWERRRDDGVQIAPIHIRSSLSEHIFGEVQSLPRNGPPVYETDNHDAAWVEIVRGLFLEEDT